MAYTSRPLKDFSPEERQKMIERSALRRKEENREKSRPMNPDHDLSWENTQFEKDDND